MELIDRQALFNYPLKEEYLLGNIKSEDFLNGIMAAMDYADLLPRIDAVTVVRCKDCVKRGLDICPMHIVGTPADEDFLKKVDDDFCSYGERRSE